MGETRHEGMAVAGATSAEEFRELLDIPFRIRVEVGRRKMKVREILAMGEGSVVELPKSAGENVDIYINGKLLGYGEVVEMEGNAGIRITDLHESV